MRSYILFNKIKYKIKMYFIAMFYNMCPCSFIHISIHLKMFNQNTIKCLAEQLQL